MSEDNIISRISKFAQNCIGDTPVIILGSGASVPYGIPGMPGLRDRLMASSPPDASTSGEESDWRKFHDSLKENDLETALSVVALPEKLTSHVVNLTWDYLAPYDYEVLKRALSDLNIKALADLYKHLLSSSAQSIHIVTPNYDRIAEYAANVAGYSFYDGFKYGYIGERGGRELPRLTYGRHAEKQIFIWKVHGSFSWFHSDNGVAWNFPSLIQRPIGLTPAIITPGIEKYRKTHDEPFTSIKAFADEALQNANAYLFIGYGFNDKHLQTKLIERIRKQKVKIILITKTASETAHSFLRGFDSVPYLIIEANDNGSKVYSNENPDGVVLSGEYFWQLPNFLKLIK